MTLVNILFVGLAGAFLMFLGDMILYYDKNDYDDKDTLNNIIAIMKKVSKLRLHIGGVLGPISAFLYCIGFYHIVLISKEKYLTLAFIIFFINVLGIICGGAYHSHCAYLGLLSRYENKEIFDEFLQYLKFQAKITYLLMGIGAISLLFMFLLNFTIFPRWIFLFTPMLLMSLTPLVGKLPKGIHMIIRGGWTNFVYVIYYLILISYYYMKI